MSVNLRLSRRKSHPRPVGSFDWPKIIFYILFNGFKAGRMHRLQAAGASLIHLL
jgi:hypothetical protein